MTMCMWTGTKKDLAHTSEIAKYVSDRHFGIGSDGMILIKSSEKADFQMDMYNADGSRGEMCGNGIRCVAKYVYDHRHDGQTADRRGDAGRCQIH